MGNRKGSLHPTYSIVLVELLVRYKPIVPDPQQAAALANTRGLGYTQVKDIDTAKYFRLKFADTTIRQARADARKAAGQLLANSVTENFEILKATPFLESVHP